MTTIDATIQAPATDADRPRRLDRASARRLRSLRVADGVTAAYIREISQQRHVVSSRGCGAAAPGLA